MYNWKQTEKAYFPREELLSELGVDALGQNISEWERKLFYWMPHFGFTNEMDVEDGTSTVTSSETASGSSEDDGTETKINLATEDTRC